MRMVRLLLILFFLLVSLLAVFQAPAYPLWLLSVIVQEFPWIFILLVLVLLLTGGFKGKYGMINALASALALVLYLSPVIRAYSVARRLDGNLQRTFARAAIVGPPDSSGLPDSVNRARLTVGIRAPPFRWWRMFTGLQDQAVAYPD